MKKFIKNLSLFIFFPATLILFLEVSILSLGENLFTEEKMEIPFRIVSNDYRWVKEVKSHSKTVLLGSSTTRYGLSCPELNKLSNNKESFVNLAMNARDPIESYFILKNLNLGEVKEVFLGLDPWIYAKSYYLNRDGYLYLDFSFMDAIKFNFEHDKATFFKRYKALFHYFFPVSVQLPQNAMAPPADFGSATLDRNPVNFNESMEKTYQIEKYGWSKLQFEYLLKIVSLCKNEHIGFNVFLPPKRSDYSEIYKKNIALIHADFIKQLLINNFSATIFGTFDQLDRLGDDKLFAEAYHLNGLGQKVYSAVFYQLIHENKVEFSKDYSWFKK